MKLHNVQALRGIAASGVVIFHAQGMAPNYLGEESLSGRIMGGLGGYGVDLFFVISGFIIRYAQPEGGYGAADFAWRRIQRVVPIYWFITAVMLLAWLALPAFYRGDFPNVGHIVRSFLFTSFLEGKSPIVYVGWSLEYEMLFYGSVFLLLILKSSLPLWPTVVTAFCTLAAMGATLRIFAPEILQMPAVHFLTSSLLLEFVLGVVIAEAAIARTIPWVSAAALVGAMALVGLASPVDRALVYGCLSGVLLSLALYVESRRSWTVPGFWVSLGDASYSIYLAQVLALSASAKLLTHLVPAMSADMFVLFVSGLSLAAGYVLYVSIEAPLTRYFSARRRRRRGMLIVAG
jgi:peptidoglycan/LPS O-acetylase OafA/YrhL